MATVTVDVDTDDIPGLMSVEDHENELDDVMVQAEVFLDALEQCGAIIPLTPNMRYDLLFGMRDLRSVLV